MRELARRTVPLRVRAGVMRAVRRLRAAGGPRTVLVTAGRRLRWRAALTHRVLVAPRWRLVAGERDPAALPVVMCLWNRPHLLARTLADLAAQRDAPPLRLLLWSNRPENDAAFLSAVRAHGASGAIASVEFHSSRVNLGGIARFVVARHLAPAKESQPFVMIDDDEAVSADFIRHLLDAYQPHGLAGLWAFEVVAGYWDRRELAAGAEADYVGTGGSICDTRLVHQRGFFSRLPARFGFLEDIWASAQAKRAGWHLTKVVTPFEFLSEDDNQYHALRDLKTVFWDWLYSAPRG
ncbi:hypothetical protein NQ156_11810 [Microbacterium sp. zg.Y625]|uniref:hypothetical protein n=1 Tax=Microbacterium jiangjiandongii TaxID=3049071 RepID=UPI00214B31FD|nr:MULTISPECIES: hypothetical protein [unclassified Microbacterium]MCR2793750.1 hypothetical protein [Microbacterium sp. zg.Y625]MCR2816170.1 hypothetical protein [Microbacterium sp. zg.Y843]WIM26094.1 hypothetical protein QNO14_03290 [Microbacterium sp. zg-Y625]